MSILIYELQQGKRLIHHFFVLRVELQLFLIRVIGFHMLGQRHIASLNVVNMLVVLVYE
ncbi:hypothetical protein D3C74_461610 [compost metagenome]